jgi:hypothetical protein|nr:hypothetical protein [Kofleriaceae bacterium]
MKRLFAMLLLVPSLASADTELGVYGDVDGHAHTQGSRDSTTDSFSAASVELFAVARQGRWSFLSEINFEADDTNEFSMDVERLEVAYVHADWLRFVFGRFPVAMGWYSDAINHGAIFQLPATRAVMVSFEDEGGLAPSHSVGVHTDGRLAVADDHIRYDVELGNGRAADLDTVQSNHDENRAKSLNVRLRYEPGGALDGLLVGANVYFDSIDADDVSPDDKLPASPALHEWIYGAHAAYLEHGFHFVTETMMVRHVELGSGIVRTTYGTFVEAGHTFDKLTPFARYERVRYPAAGDPYYQRDAADSFDAVSAGIRHATNDNIALKLQATASKAPVPGSSVDYALTGQIAFGF